MSELDRAVLERVFAFEHHTVERLLTCQPHRRLATLQTATGPVLTVAGRKIHSGRDPQREAVRWVRQLDLVEMTVLVVLGYGSGYAIRELRKRTSASIVVFDPDPDQLAIGLTHGPVPDNVVMFTELEPFGQFLKAFLQGPDRGSILRWAASVRTHPGVYEQAIERAKEAVGRVKLTHQTSMLRGKGWLSHYLTNLPQLCSGVPLSRVSEAMKGVPAIVVAAGPSLDRNIALLRELDDTALILTCNTATRALAKAGVRPHAIVTIESADTTASLEGLPWELPAFVELTAHPKMWARPFPHTFPISVDTNGCSTFSNLIDPGLGLSAGFCVANASVAIAHRLGCDPIILIGSDLAFQGDRVYAQNTIFETERIRPNDDGTVRLEGNEARKELQAKSAEALGFNSTPSRHHVVTVEGWHRRGDVTTSPDFKMFRDWYTYAADRMNVELINATEGGAHIPGWQHRRLADVFHAYQLRERGPRPAASERMAALCARPTMPTEPVLEAIRREIAAVESLLGLAREARAMVADDPDGDLQLSDAQTARLIEINARARQLMREAPLAGEACYAPIEHLRLRGHLSTFALYRAMDDPLLELRASLFEVLGRLCAQSSADSPGASSPSQLSAVRST